MGAYGNSSVMGLEAGMPYTAAVEENTRRLTPARNMAVNSDSEPQTLFAKYNSGLPMDSPTAMYAAKWMTASTGRSPMSRTSASVSATFTTRSRPGSTL